MSSLCHVDCGDAGVEQLLRMSLGFSRAPSWLDCLFFFSAEEALGCFFSVLESIFHVADGS